MKIRFFVFLLMASMCLGASTQSASAWDIEDPKPPLTFQEMTDCDLVVVARYESHTTGEALREEPETAGSPIHEKKQTLSLRAIRVLRGTAVKPGDVFDVELRHWYTIETKPLGFRARLGEAEEKDVPKLCYKMQLMNPGGLSATKIVPDVRADVLYFFPGSSPRTLERRNQVQPLFLEKGWQQALSRQSIDLSFRLAQGSSESIRRSALEELDASRDSRTLDTLFDWLNAPNAEDSRAYIAEQTLKTISDRNGDVYNRARKRLMTMPRDWVPYFKMPREQQLREYSQQSLGAARLAFSKYAGIMAEVDGERAARDFARMVVSEPPALAEQAAHGLGDTHSGFALGFAFKMLEKPETALAGAAALHELTFIHDPESDSQHDWMPQAARLQVLALPRLSRALSLPVFDASRTDAALAADAPENLKWMRHNRNWLESTLATAKAPPQIELARAEQVLLHPNEKTFARGYFGRGNQYIDSEGVLLLKGIDAAADPRFIPLLVKLLHDRSPALDGGTSNLREIIARYSILFPNAFKRELEKQDVHKVYPDDEILSVIGFYPHFNALFGNPQFLYEIRLFDASFVSLKPRKSSWFTRYGASPTTVQQLVRKIKASLDEKQAPQTEALQFVLSIDPKIARPLLQRTIDMRQEFAPRERASVLALAIANGHSDLSDELLRLVEVSMDRQRSLKSSQESDHGEVTISSIGPNDVGVYFLLLAKSRRATSLYLKMLDETPKTIEGKASFGRQSATGGEKQSNPMYAGMVQSLFPRYPKEFFPRVTKMLRSSSLSERRAGQYILKNTLNWDLDFEAAYLARERATRLKTVEPLLQKFQTLTETQTRVLVLKELGVNLPDAPRQWFPVLLRSASNPNRSIATNSLILLGALIGEDSPMTLAPLSAPTKVKAFQDMLEDRGFTMNVAQQFNLH